MSDMVVFALLSMAQIVVSIALAMAMRRLAPASSRKAQVAVGACLLPSLFAVFAFWMIFRLGRVSDLAGMAIAVCVMVALLLLPLGLVSSILMLKFLGRRASK